MKSNSKVLKIPYILTLLVFVCYLLMAIPFNIENIFSETSTLWIDNTDVEQLTPYTIYDEKWVDISTAEELAYLCKQINLDVNDYKNYNVRLIDNIDLKGKTIGNQFVNLYWMPIKEFTKIFDGQGFTISNMWINYDATEFNSDTGFWGSIWGGTVQNVNFYNCGISKNCTPSHSIGIVAGAVGGGIIENCRVIVENGIYNNVISFTKTNSNIDLIFGGIVGWAKDSIIKGCHIEDRRSEGDTFNFDNCFSSLYWNQNNQNNLLRCHIGGIVGMMVSVEQTSTITLCSSSANISEIHMVDVAMVGGIVGCAVGLKDNLYIDGNIFIEKNCNYGDVTVGNAYAWLREIYTGGIVGYSKCINSIKYCYNTGTLYSYSNKNEMFCNKTNTNVDALLNSINSNKKTSDYLLCDITKMKGDYYLFNGRKYYYSERYSPKGYEPAKQSVCIEWGQNYCGGIIGYNDSFTSTYQVYQCYNSGTIDSQDNCYLNVKYLTYLYIIHLDMGRNSKARCYSEITITSSYKLRTFGYIIGGGNNTSYLCYSYNQLNDCSTKELNSSIDQQVQCGFGNIETFTPTASLANHHIAEEFDKGNLPGYNIDSVHKTCIIRLKDSADCGYMLCFTQNNNKIGVRAFFAWDAYEDVHSSVITVFEYNLFTAEGDTNISTNFKSIQNNTEVWAQDPTNKINKGLPYLKEMYWGSAGQEPLSYMLN